MPVKISNTLVKENSGYGRTINQLMEIFVLKEMQSREIREKEFQAVIVEIFGDGRKPKIYLNEEAIFVLSYKDRAPNELGPIKVNLDELKNIEWDDKVLDSNSAKFFILRWNNDWILHFDFRYNKTLANQRLTLAKNFLYVTKDIKPDFLNVIIYNLWSCGELIVDIKLLLMAQLPKDENRHARRNYQLKKFKKTSDIFSNDFCDYFLKLSSDKNAARYGGIIKNKFTADFVSNIINVFEQELDSIRI